MGKPVCFADLVKVTKGGHLLVAEENLSYVQDLMRQAGTDDSRELHQMVGQGIREPIRQLAAYVAWTPRFFVPWNLGDTEDNRIPVDEPIAVAYITHPDGEVFFVRPNLRWARPDFTMMDTGVEINWKTMRAAGWPVLRRKMTEASEELARQVDTLGQAALNVAVTAIAGHVFAVAGAITKISIDGVFQAAATIGFPIRHVAVNAGTVLAMRAWTGSTFGLENLPDDEVRALLYRGYLGEYGGAAWYAHSSVPVNFVYLAGDPDAVGYHQMRGGTRTASDVDIRLKVDLHTMEEEHAFYVGNAYNLWRLEIT